MSELSKRQERVLQILREPNLVLEQDPWSAVWLIGPRFGLKFSRDSRYARASLKSKEVSDMESLGLIKIIGKGCTGKSVYSLS